jgi:hypothetical protein
VISSEVMLRIGTFTGPESSNWIAFDTVRDRRGAGGRASPTRVSPMSEIVGGAIGNGVSTDPPTP